MRRGLSRIRLDGVGRWAALGSLGLHAAVLSAALAAATLRPGGFTPGPAKPAAGLSVPVLSSVERASPELPEQTPPPAAPSRAASPTRTDASVRAPAALIDAEQVADFTATLAEPLVRASTPAAAGQVRSAPTVFGVQGQREAERVVYLVDASGSMVAALPVVLREVARSIDALAPEQRFTVGVFGAGEVRAPESLASGRDSLIPATESNKAAVRRWLTSVEARGGGDALGALRWGLAHRPDIVFVMAKGISDRGQTGEQREATATRFLAEMERLNPKDATRGLRPVRIRAIEFFDADAAGLLERLGQEHGEFEGAAPGSGHRFISRREFGLE